MSKNRTQAYLALIVATIIWGIAFPIIKPALDYISAMQYLFFRFMVAGLISLPFIIFYCVKHRPKISYIIKVTLIETLGITIPLLLLYEGLDATSALEASLIGSLAPLFIVVGSIWYLKERQTKREWQGLAISFLGSLILILDPILNGQAILGSSLRGNLLIMAYNMAYTVYAIVAKHTYKKSPPIILSTISYSASAIIYGLILASQNTIPSLSLLTIPSVLVPILYMAIPGGIIAFALHLYAVGKIEVSEANLFTYLNGVVAIPVAALLLHEYPTPLTLIAIFLITWGVLLAETKKR